MTPTTWHIRDLLKVTSDYLRKKEIENPRLNAEVLMAHQLSVERISLYLNFDQPLTDKEVSGYRSLIRRRLKREPLQYITGTQEFWSLDFFVNQEVLIPRPETEIVVDQVINFAKSSARPEDHDLKILDLGTGSGAISVALAKELPRALVWATDISEGALSMARRNATKHGVSDRIEFLQGDLWEPLMNRGVIFDIVVSNPPYVSSKEYDDLPPEIRDYEPRVALNGREGGMYYLNKIIKGAYDFINPGGLLILEMAPDQTQKALTIMDQTAAYGEKARIKDYSHRYRVVVGSKP